MSLQAWAWLATAAYALHVMEEYSFNWRDWARGTYRLVVEGFKKDGDGKPVQISSYPFALEGRLGAP